MNAEQPCPCIESAEDMAITDHTVEIERLRREYGTYTVHRYLYHGRSMYPIYAISDTLIKIGAVGWYLGHCTRPLCLDDHMPDHFSASLDAEFMTGDERSWLVGLAADFGPDELNEAVAWVIRAAERRLAGAARELAGAA